MIRSCELTNAKGSSLVSQGVISMGDLTSLLLYTVYVGSGLQMLTYGRSFTHISSFLIISSSPTDHSS
jgi:hypothetical protein